MSDRSRNPFRSEGDAFRVLMIVVAAGALVLAVTLVTRPLIGALVGLVLVGVALWRAWSWAREWFAARAADSEADDRPPDAREGP